MEPRYSCHMLIIPHAKYALEDRMLDHIQMREVAYGANSNYSLEDSWTPFYFSR